MFSPKNPTNLKSKDLMEISHQETLCKKMKKNSKKLWKSSMKLQRKYKSPTEGKHNKRNRDLGKILNHKKSILSSQLTKKRTQLFLSRVNYRN